MPVRSLKIASHQFYQIEYSHLTKIKAFLPMSKEMQEFSDRNGVPVQVLV